MGGLYQQEQWSGLQTIVIVERIRHLWNKTTREVQFYLTSLPANAQLLGRAIRQHWTGENQVHWQLKYVALEPNKIDRDRFLQRLDQTSFDENVEVSVRDEYFEPGGFEREQKYDLVLLTHVLYYWRDTPKNVGWVEGRETQQRLTGVGFRASTQPTSNIPF